MKKLRLIGPTQRPSADENNGTERTPKPFEVAKRTRADEFWKPLFVQFYFLNPGEVEENPDEKVLCERREIIRTDVVRILKVWSGEFTNGECALPGKYPTHRLLFESIMFILAFDMTFEYLEQDDAGGISTDTDKLDEEDFFQSDVRYALDDYILKGAALARKVGSTSYATWTNAMLALADLTNGSDEEKDADATAKDILESVIEAQRQLWADTRCVRECALGVQLDVHLDSENGKMINKNSRQKRKRN